MVSPYDAPMTKRVDVDTYRALFAGDDEFAIIDARPADHFAQCHLLSASNFPLEVLTEQLPTVVPAKTTHVVICDHNDGSATQAADLLSDHGYQDLAVLDGGIPAWHAAGGELFSGISVLGKAFGEYVEQRCGTPSITVSELRQRQLRGQTVLLLDSRTAEEHESYCIPGAILCPGAELAYRVGGVAMSDDPIVVHCGGRTRSILGAQTLIDFGFRGAVSLENGTQAWMFENLELELEPGDSEELRVPDDGRLADLQRHARELMRRFGISAISALPAASTRTRYLIDVRGQSEFEAGHVAGSRHIPGGHLLQNIDLYLVVRNAEVVLIDSDGIRAPTIAVWLRRMGWPRVRVWQVDPQSEHLVSGAEALGSPREVRMLNPNDYSDHAELIALNRAFLEWQRGLVDQLADEPAASCWRIEPGRDAV